MRRNKFLIGWLRGVYFSSIVNEVIKTISIFLRNAKKKKTGFPPLRRFCARKTVAFVVFSSLVFVLFGGFGLICVFVRLKLFGKRKLKLSR